MRMICCLCLLGWAGVLPATDAWTLQSPISQRAAVSASPALISGTRIVIDPSLRADDRELQLPLADGLQVRAVRTGGTRRGADDYSWIGHVDGDPEQQVLLTRRGAYLGGYLSLKQGIYELRPSPDGNVLLQLDSERFPRCGGGLPAPAAGNASVLPAPDAMTGHADEGTTVDVLLVFSPGTTTQLGGTAQALTFAESAVDLSNLAFTNSQMLTRFRLAGVRFTARADSGDPFEDLPWLTGDAEVAAWRNETRADLVSMISEFGGSCGLGYVMSSPPGVGFAPSAFQVSARGCAVGNLSFPHEHGHNMGFQHNPEDGLGATPAFPYAFGHYVSGSYRTVMSYATPCVGGCTRRPYFSNPDVLFMGVPTGIADQRDNARAGNQTAPIVAAFRSSSFGNGFE